MNDSQKIALAMGATFMTGWVQAALYGHPNTGIVFGFAAVMMQIAIAFSFDEGDEP